ncbi:MAG: CHRD domain-containing protein [Candidatus Binatia bacterium]
MRTFVCCVIAALAFSVAVPARAHVFEKTLPLTVGETAPPAIGAPAAAGGLATLELTEDLTIEYEVTVHDLSGKATIAHIHDGPPGVLGGIPAFGTLTQIDDTTFRGETPPLTPTQVQSLLDGEYYVNVHTAANPLGEVRGQITSLERVAGKCSCLTLTRKKFLKCVKTEVAKLGTEKKSAEAKALKKAAKKSSCGLSQTKKPLACCVPLNGTGEIVSGAMCAPVKKEAQCTALSGTIMNGQSCVPTNPCFLPASPSGAFLDATY